MAKKNREPKQVLKEYFEVPRTQFRAFMGLSLGGACLVLGLSLLGLGSTGGYLAAGLLIALGGFGVFRGALLLRNKQPLIVFHPQGLEPRAWGSEMPPLIPWKDMQRCEAFLCPGNNACDYLAIDLYPDAKQRLKPSSRLQKRFEAVRNRYNVEYDLLLENSQFGVSISDVAKEATRRIKAAQPDLYSAQE